MLRLRRLHRAWLLGGQRRLHRSRLLHGCLLRLRRSRLRLVRRGSRRTTAPGRRSRLLDDRRLADHRRLLNDRLDDLRLNDLRLTAVSVPGKQRLESAGLRRSGPLLAAGRARLALPKFASRQGSPSSMLGAWR
ncbi:hypothetical protein [Agromyces sp. LHK192]|uniref:hypothetical protein n=1 Tax=Agromyces sp. LHK192 TaxID=2498704 RepID=UPI0013E3C241|nr:hypothetical protein [Agromyces sp. LHK192]